MFLLQHRSGFGMGRDAGIPGPCRWIKVWDGQGCQNSWPVDGSGFGMDRDAGIPGLWMDWPSRCGHNSVGALSENLNLNVKKLLFITGGISSPSPFVTWSGAVTLLISNK